MAAKKNFANIAEESAPVYDTLIGADPQQRKPRRTPDAQEAQQALDNLKTQGQKGVKAPRINLAFTPANYDFVHVMSRIRGQNMTQFINDVLAAERDRNGEAYQQAKALVEATTIRRED